MSQQFVPFIPLGSGAGIQSQPSASQDFKAITTATPAPKVEETQPASGAHQPTVKVHREGDSVRRIQIQCSCGQVIELDCQY